MSVQNTIRANPGRVESALVDVKPSYHAWISLGAVALVAIASAGWVVANLPHRTTVLSNQVSVEEQTAPVSATVSGRVRQLLVKPGDAVKAGQLVAVLDAPQLTLAVAKAQQAVVQAQKEAQATQAAVLPPSILGSTPSVPAPPAPENMRALPLPRGTHPLEAPKIESAPKADRVDGGIDPAAMQQKLKVQAAVRQLEATAQLMADKVKAAETDLAAATQEAQNAHGPLEGLQANLDMAKAQRDKYESLYNQGIISRSEFQNKQADVDAAQTAIDEANKQITDADATVKQRQADVDSDKKLVATLNTELNAAETSLSAIHTAQPAPAAVAPSKPEVLPEPPILKAPSVPVHVAPPPVAPLGVAFSPQKHTDAMDHLAKLKQELAKAEAGLSAAEVRASTAGVVGDILVPAGRFVPAGKPLFQIERPETMSVRVNVLQSDAPRIKKGDPCQVYVANNPQERFAGAVQGFVSPGDGGTPAVVEIRPADPAGLPTGVVLNATIETGS